MIKIGNKKVPSIMMAPMSGYTDLAFRTMARRYGAKFCFFEMIDAVPLLMKKPDILRDLATNFRDRPVAAQLLGGDPAKMLDAAYVLLGKVPGISFLDVNSACPVKKVLKTKAGAWLMNYPDALAKITKTLSDNLRLPITVKLRSGFSKADPACLAGLVKRLGDSGVSAVFIHGRTCKQMYSGKVDYESIRAAKKTASIPVFGSGDVFSPELAKKMFDETGCDGILIARGALGSPWIFRDIEAYLKTNRLPGRKNIMDRKRLAMKEHIKLAMKHKKPEVLKNFGFMKKIAMWYTKGFPDSTTLRDRICKTKDHVEFLDFIETI